MKRVLALVMALCMVVGFAAAQGSDTGPLMAPGDLAVTAGIGYGIFIGAMDFSAGVEFMLGQFDIGDAIPLTYGAAIKGSYYSWTPYIGSDWIEAYLGAGAFATLHLAARSLNLPDGLEWFGNTDFYIGLGAGFYSYTSGLPGTSDTAFRIGFRSTGGVNYFITPNIAINLEGGYYGYSSGGGMFGILFKL